MATLRVNSVGTEAQPASVGILRCLEVMEAAACGQTDL